MDVVYWFYLKAFLVSPEFYQKLIWISASRHAILYSVLSAIETQQPRLYKLQPLQVLLCWHLLPVQQQGSKAEDSHRSCWAFLSNSLWSKSKDGCITWRGKMYSFAERPPLYFVSTDNDSEWLCVFVIVAGWRADTLDTHIAVLPWADSITGVDLPDRLPTS